jgi:small subunit ribosomal protein S4e
MAKKSGSLRTKRTNVPSFWRIAKKRKRVVVRTTAGPHSSQSSYPLLVVLRDILGVVKTRKEGRLVLNEGKILVDGRKVRSPGFPVGLMDVLEIPSMNKSYRIVPDKGGVVPVEAREDERGLKFCQVRSKKTIRRGNTALGMHDGRVLTFEQMTRVKPGDSCIITLPDQKIQNSYQLAKSELALIVDGERSGEVVTIDDLKAGTFSRAPIASVRLADESTSEIPTRMLLPLGKELPPITVNRPKAS